MRKKILTLLAIFLIICLSQSVSASTIDLYDWGFNIDGTMTVAPGEYDVSGMPVTGSLDGNDLGTLTWSTSTAGDHSFIAWFDYEIDEGGNTYYNESGAATGTLEAGQSWEIDEPGYVFGDIRTYWVEDPFGSANWVEYTGNVENGNLDNFNNVPTGLEDDVSFAMGWNFTLLADETATIGLILDTTAPDSGFYLSQTDPDSLETIYFSSSLSISSDIPEAPIPEPSTLILFVFGLLGSAGLSRRKG